jgi:hypothetical protein
LNVFCITLPPHKDPESIFKHPSHVHINSIVTFHKSTIDSILNSLVGLLSDNKTFSLLILKFLDKLDKALESQSSQLVAS